MEPAPPQRSTVEELVWAGADADEVVELLGPEAEAEARDAAKRLANTARLEELLAPAAAAMRPPDGDTDTPASGRRRRAEPKCSMPRPQRGPSDDPPRPEPHPGAADCAQTPAGEKAPRFPALKRLAPGPDDWRLKRQALAAAVAAARADPHKYGRILAGTQPPPAPPPQPGPFFSTGQRPAAETEPDDEWPENETRPEHDTPEPAEETDDTAPPEPQPDTSGPQPPTRPPPSPPPADDAEGQGDAEGEPLPLEEQLRRVRELRARLRRPQRYPPKPGTDPAADADYQSAHDTTRAIQDRHRAEAIEKLRRAEPDDGKPLPKIEE